jgi:hypothetical protein
MSWAKKYRVPGGKPIITGHAPGKALQECIGEIHDKVITDIHGDGGGGSANGVEHEVEITAIRSGNKVTIGGRVFVEIPDSGDVLPTNAQQYQSLIWNGTYWVAGWPVVHD